MKNLLVSTCITRRIRRRAIRDYQIGECQNSSYPFNDCTYKSILGAIPNNRGLRFERGNGKAYREPRNPVDGLVGGIVDKTSVKTFLSMPCCTMNPKVYTQYPMNKPATAAAVIMKPGCIKKIVRKNPPNAAISIKAVNTARLPIMVKETIDPVLDSEIFPLMEGKNELR